MRKRIAVLALVVLGLVGGNGCGSKQDQMVAQVGKDMITVGKVANDFVAMKKGSQVQITSTLPLLEQVKQFVDQEIDGKLQIQAAYEIGFDKDPQIVSQLDQNKDKLLLQQLFQKEVLSKAKVTDKDVEDFYKKLGERIKVRHILVKTKKEADQIYQDLKKGANFDSLAKEKSIDPGTKEKGGDLGSITWNAMTRFKPLQRSSFQVETPGDLPSGQDHCRMACDQIRGKKKRRAKTFCRGKGPAEHESADDETAGGSFKLCLRSDGEVGYPDGQPDFKEIRRKSQGVSCQRYLADTSWGCKYFPRINLPQRKGLCRF